MHIFSVSSLTQAVKDVVEGEFPFVWVRGQVSTVSTPPSGHIYFTLRDAQAVLNTVWFKGAQPCGQDERVNPLTGEVETGPGVDISEGQALLVGGRLQIYSPRGVYQLMVEVVQSQGQGELAIAFEALKKNLAVEGYFDADRKLFLPQNPRRIAVITAPQGAAFQDFLRLATDRGLGATLRLYPSLMQGERAAEQVASALRLADAHAWAEVIVLIRGGGSLEDLWTFNTATVAEAIFHTRLPVLTGIGHEVDTTIADFVADARAATPSHAAQLLWTDRQELIQRLDEAALSLHKAAARAVDTHARSLEHWVERLFWRSPLQSLESQEQVFAELSIRLHRSIERLYRERIREFTTVKSSLTYVYKQHLRDVSVGLQEVRRTHAVTGMQYLQQQFKTFTSLAARLDARNPEAPLKRGYALVRKQDGQIVSAKNMVQTAEILHVRVGDGTFSVRVEKNLEPDHKD